MRLLLVLIVVVALAGHELTADEQQNNKPAKLTLEEKPLKEKSAASEDPKSIEAGKKPVETERSAFTDALGFVAKEVGKAFMKQNGEGGGLGGQGGGGGLSSVLSQFAGGNQNRNPLQSGGQGLLNGGPLSGPQSNGLFQGPQNSGFLGPNGGGSYGREQYDREPQRHRENNHGAHGGHHGGYGHSNHNLREPSNGYQSNYNRDPNYGNQYDNDYRRPNRQKEQDLRDTVIRE